MSSSAEARPPPKKSVKKKEEVRGSKPRSAAGRQRKRPPSGSDGATTSSPRGTQGSPLVASTSVQTPSSVDTDAQQTAVQSRPQGVSNDAAPRAAPLPSTKTQEAHVPLSKYSSPALTDQPSSSLASASARRRSGSKSRRLLVCRGLDCTHWLVCCTLSAIVVVVLSTLWFISSVWSSPQNASYTCVTPGCLAYSRRLLASINSSVNPCTSFTRFVCDGWQHGQRLSVWEDQFHFVLDRLTKELQGVDIPETQQNEEQQAAAVYSSCTSVLYGGSDELEAVKTALEDAGIVWPRPSKGADVLRTLLHSSLKLGFDVLFDIYVSPTDRTVKIAVDPGKCLLFVLTKRERLTDTKQKKAYFEFLKEAFQRDGTVAVSFEETFDVAEPVLDILGELYERVSDEHPTEAGGLSHAPEIGLTEYRWLSILQGHNVSVANGLLLETSRADYLEAALNFWKKHGSDAFHSFVSWCTVQVAALFARRDLVLNYYDQSPRLADIYHRAFCLGTSMFISRKAPFSRYNAHVLHGNSEAIARQLTLLVRSAFSKRLSKWEYFDESITVVSNWSSLERAFRNFEPSEEENASATARARHMTSSFLSNWRQSVRERPTEEIENIIRTIYNLDYYYLSYEFYDFQLMPYALSFPLFDVGLPRSLNYGGFGAEVSSALGELLLLSYEEGKNVSQVRSLIECVRSGPFGAVKDPEMYTAYAIGYGPLVDAYKNYANGSDWAVLGLEKYTGLQLLFIALCYLACDGNDRTDGESVCNISVQYLPEFAEAFQCAPGDPMNLASRCRLP
ncbi:membrane metallo-endopeptidase-like 1 isoform X2 [Dermacentor albipictus]|uniref:membrane metallo-endopeptidase-like 1 isoform X2 n=1 Tax=Dermacentor albipictus TaxID=60249 RepID=UPI0038FC5686